MDTPHPLLAEWRRLILPPAGLPLTGGEQQDYDNRYPDAAIVDLEAHLAGHRTYAVDLAYPLDGQRWTKCGVLDIDEGVDSPAKADLLRQQAEAQGITAALAFSGRKGCHVWLFSEPVPVETIRAVLKKLKAAVPHRGELAPLDVQRVKLPPAWHRVGLAWAAFYRPGEPPPRLLEQKPTAEFLDGQAALLAELQPTPANVLAAFAFGGQPAKATTDPDTTRPHLERLPPGEHPPCITALVQFGPSPGQGRMTETTCPWPATATRPGCLWWRRIAWPIGWRITPPRKGSPPKTATPSCGIGTASGTRPRWLMGSVVYLCWLINT